MREPLRDIERLRHILEAISNIETASDGITKDELEKNFILRHALTWNVMIIGEAANKITKEFCAEHPVTPWRSIAGMRHVLVHDYYKIDVDELWDVITADLPDLKSQIAGYIKELSGHKLT